MLLFNGSQKLLMKFLTLFFLAFLVLVGCKNDGRDKICDNLNRVKTEFLHSICEENADESPFFLHYTFRTVFFSKKVVSLFGEMNVYDHLPHGWARYEGKTFCKIHGTFREITLDDLFDTPSRKEFVRKYCEDVLKRDPCSHFAGREPLMTGLNQEDVHTFVIDDKFLRIIFEPYAVGGFADGPFVVSIPYDTLKGQWKPSNPLTDLLAEVITSESYTSSWDEKNFTGNW
jgi:hypothetical protein